MKRRFELAANLLPSLLARLPRYPGSFLFASAVNAMLRSRLPTDVQEQMDGKNFRIHIRDARLTFDFQWLNRSFVARRDMAEPDLTISASVNDFMLLAQRREDPDTLFFSRRLTMEGDTELGLLVKNTIDAVGPTLFDLSQLAPARVLAKMGITPAAPGTH